MDKVYCIDNRNLSLYITIGKWYDIYADDDITDQSLIIYNDRGTPSRIDRRCFKTLQELRNDKLEKIGI